MSEGHVRPGQAHTKQTDRCALEGHLSLVWLQLDTDAGCICRLISHTVRMCGACFGWRFVYTYGACFVTAFRSASAYTTWCYSFPCPVNMWKLLPAALNKLGQLGVARVHGILRDIALSFQSLLKYAIPSFFNSFSKETGLSPSTGAASQLRPGGQKVPESFQRPG